MTSLSTSNVTAQSDAIRLHWGIKIPMRDGVQLNATLYLPERACAPAIFTLTPYIGQTYHDTAMYFASHGYPFLTVDVRGRGNSEGTFRPLINEACDAYDTVEWLAWQSYCDGKVSMWGGSYGGYVQWAAASRRPPHLATIVPVASPFIGVDFPIRNNIAAPYWMQWLSLVWGRTSQDRLFWSNERFWGERFRRWLESGAPFRELDFQLGNPSSTFQEWVSHPQQDEYWDRYNPAPEQYAGLPIPVLTITGHYDGDQLGALKHYREHCKYNPNAEHFLIIGPWDHAGTRMPMSEFCGLKLGPASLIDLPKLHLEWYRWTMQGGARPPFLKHKVAYYVMGAEQWRYANSLDAITESSTPYFFHSNGPATDVFQSGSLYPSGSGQGGPDEYVYDPCDIGLARLESMVDPESRADQRMVMASVGKQLVYHAEPFDEPIEISGFFRLVAWLAIDQPDTDFRATVYEVRIDGSVILLSMDSIRARYRKSLRSAELISTTEPRQYDFERFHFVSRRIARGSRLRLVIGPINSIYSQKNYNSGGVVAEEGMADARPVAVKLYHEDSCPSALYVPFGCGENADV